jgi:hypothetical protein
MYATQAKALDKEARDAARKAGDKAA